MRYDFTPAARRVLHRAVAWSKGQPPDDVRSPALLLSLLREDECWAASVLAQAGIDQKTVMERWDIDGPGPSSEEASVDEQAVRVWGSLLRDLEQVEQHLEELPRPMTHSTEHLLLALVDSSSPVGAWLREKRLSANTLVNEIYHLHGVTAGPLPLEAVEHSEHGETTGMGTFAESDDTTLLRILDASANRAGEALRVIEDYLRFGLEDQHLIELAKSIRHDLSQTLSGTFMPLRLAARNTVGDVGTNVSTEAEYQRANVTDVIEANFTRLQQSLRSLEEFAKVRQSGIAAPIEQLRYRTYTLHRAVGNVLHSRKRLADARLYVLIDGRDSLEAFRELAICLVQAGVHVLQLRDKSLGDRELLERGRTLRDITGPSETIFIMNDRPDLAILSDADGVHVGQEELAVAEVRKLIGPEKLIGVSTHNIEQARQAVNDGANYIGVGPTFASSTKQFAEFPGLPFARQVADGISLPAFAIGGVDLTNVHAIVDAGLQRIAAGHAIVGASDPSRTCEEFFSILNAQD